LVAVAVNVYAVPTVSPDTVTGEDAPDPVSEPGEDVTVYPVIDDPPVAPGVTATDALFVEDPYAAPEVFVALTAVGACGTVVAVTPVEAELADDVPYALDAETVYVYCVLDASPVTVIGEDDPVNVDGDVVGVGVTVNVDGCPPFELGVNATDICPLLYARDDG
jgi:hypothetical protein